MGYQYCTKASFQPTVHPYRCTGMLSMLSCGITNGSTCADQTQMVTEPWASSLCVLVFWRWDAGPSLAENETRPEMECNLDEDTAAVVE